MKILLFLLISLSSYSQVFKLEYVAVQEYNDSTNKIDKFVKWDEIEGSVYFNGKSSIIEIYAEFKHLFTITEFLKEEYTEERNSILMQAYDDFKNKCMIELVFYPKKHIYQLYLRYSNVNITYQIQKQ